MRGRTHEFVEALARLRVPGLVDLYVEAVREVRLLLKRGEVASREDLRREGAAVRIGSELRSTDGLDRPAVAALLDVQPRSLPSLRPPELPQPPLAEEMLALARPDTIELRWRASRARVVGDLHVEIERPELLEVTVGDGQRSLVVWPVRALADSPLPPMGDERPRSRPVRTLLAPEAAATLLHELVGHPLEADLLLAGTSPWTGKRGQTLLSLALDVTDDPTRLDLPGGFSHDDEGAEAHPRPLVAGGLCAGVLTDSATSSLIGVPGGNGRRGSVHAAPSPRLSNLVAGGGTDALEALRREAEIEVGSVAGAWLDAGHGAVVLAVRRAVALRRGRPRPLAPFLLRGAFGAVALGLLGATPERRTVATPGWCGKGGDPVPVGAVAPWLLLEGLEVV